MIGRVIVIGCTELTARLPEALAGHGLEVVAVGGDASPFRNSHFVDRFVALRSPFSVQAWAAELLDHPGLEADPHDWLIHCRDDLPGALARAQAPLDRRLALLPVLRAEGLPMLGTKLGLAALLQAEAIPTPFSRAVLCPEELEAALAAFCGPLMLKADFGAAGLRVRRAATPSEVLADPPLLGWYPLLLQRWVAGQGCSIEALFGGGLLLGLLPSTPLRSTHDFGPNLARRFLREATAGVVAALQALGRAGGLHGLFNCSFRLPEGGSDALLYEADPRPNAWHAHGPGLGVDWGALMAAQTSSGNSLPCPLQPWGLHPEGQVLYLFPRGPQHALQALSWSAALPWLLCRSGTWDRRLRRDRAIGVWEWQQVGAAARPWRRFLLLPFRAVARALPAGLRRNIRERDLAATVLRWLMV